MFSCIFPVKEGLKIFSCIYVAKHAHTHIYTLSLLHFIISVKIVKSLYAFKENGFVLLCYKNFVISLKCPNKMKAFTHLNNGILSCFYPSPICTNRYKLLAWLSFTSYFAEFVQLRSVYFFKVYPQLY